MRRKYSKVPHTFRKLKKRILFFVCWICSHLWGFCSQFKAFCQTIPLLFFLMHVNFTDQRLGRIWSRTSTSTWTLSKQVIPLVSRHDIHRSCVGLWNLNLLRSVLTPFPLAKRMKARSFDSASWTNSANFCKARLLLWISIYINASPLF